MFLNVKDEEMRSFAKNSIENLEKWARYLISSEMSAQYGDDFFYKQLDNGEYLIKKDIREHAKKLFENGGKRYNKEIDTLFIDHIVSILCKENLYNNCFKKCLDSIYPEGRMEARTFLSRIIPVRNKLSHSNPISFREAEQTICYSNDFVEGVKNYMKKQGYEKEFNVPNIIRINDSLGNEYYPKNDNNNEIMFVGNECNEKNMNEFNCGDDYSVWATMDPSFKEDEYVVEWHLNRKKYDGMRMSHRFSEEDVGNFVILEVKVISNKRWHKFTFYDQQVSLVFKVLPPI